MTLVFNDSIKAWSDGFDAREAGLPRESPTKKYVVEWEAGWDAADSLTEQTKSDDSADNYRIYDPNGTVLKP